MTTNNKELSPTLYILMRSDMASMNAGKGMAQASHASNAFVKHAKSLKVREGLFEKALNAWENSTDQGFGTCIVLEAPDYNRLVETINAMSENGYIAGMVRDPTYPLMDGKFLHLIDINTCAYVFVPDRNNDFFAKTMLHYYNLHP